MDKTSRTIPSRKTLKHLIEGLIKYHPDVYLEKGSATATSQTDVYNQKKASFDKELELIFGKGYSIEDVVAEVRTWENYYKLLDEGSLAPDLQGKASTIPKNIDELVQAAEIVQEKERLNAFERERKNKELLRQLYEASEKNTQKEVEPLKEAEQEDLISQKPTKETPPITKEEKDQKTPSVKKGVQPPKEAVVPTPPIKKTPSVQAPEPPSEGIVLKVIKSADINPITRGALKVATLPFFLAAPEVAKTPEGQVTATAQHMLYREYITSSTFASVKPKALSLGVSPDKFDQLLKTIAEQERLRPNLFNRISSVYGIQEIVVRTGVPQYVAGELFLAPSSESGSLVMPRKGFFGNIIGKMGQQLLGNFFKGTAKKGLAEGATKAISTVAKAEPHVRAVMMAASALKAVVKFLKGQSDGDGGTVATVALLGGGIALFSVAPVLGGGLLGAGALSGGATLAGKSGGYGNLATKMADFGQNALQVIAGGVAVSIGVPAVVTFIALPLVIAIILFIINSGAYIVPPTPSSIPGAIESPYIGIDKEASPNQINRISGSQTITYSVRIYAKKGTLSNIRIANEYKVISRSSPALPNPQVPEINNPPTIISPVEDYVFEYQIQLDGSYNDSIVVDTLTVTADAPEQVDALARTSASVVIGNPPISCPLPGGSTSTRHASYIPGVETGGHGSTDYWNRMGGTACRYGLPQKECRFTNDPRARDSGNPCYSPSGCSTYGYAIDVFGSPGQEVFLPTVDGQSVNWSFVESFAVGQGIYYKYRSGQYILALTHLASGASTGSGLPSGTAIGRLYNQGSNTHVHIEFSINGQWVRPEDYFCF